MVATRSTDQVVSFVTGQEKVDPTTIRMDQWVAILRSAIDELPVNYLRGLKSIKQILHYDDPNGGVHRIVESPLPKLWTGLPDSSREIRANEVFLNCADFGGGFPYGQYPFESWPKAPRRTMGQPNDRREMLMPIHTGNMLLSRDKKLYYLQMAWFPKEEWDEEPISSTPARFWYQADPLAIKIRELDDKTLEQYLAAAHERNVGQVMLQRFHLALSETANDVRGQYDHVLEKKQIVAGYLDRIGRLAN